ncbi:MAG: MarR family winged helix-turn-helix transcriptional regulator [Candidatus Dadabacteria bacterium]|jgi:DNA-binding MarR family transcriptional regulator
MEKTKIASLIERIGNLLRSEERASGADSGLQSVHVQILNYLYQCNRYSNTPAGVTEFIGSTKGTTSQSINILEKKGFIKKYIDDEDGRVIRLYLTEKGEDFIKNEFPPTDFCRALDTLSTKDSDYLSQLLTKLLVQLQLENKSKLFGVCHTCNHFKKFGLGDTHQCGLTLEPLSEKESFLICREHEQSTKKAV